MTGQWTRREADEHQCEKPKYGESREKPARQGDEWTCGVCNRKWVVHTIIVGDQRDPMPGNFISEWRESQF